MVNIQPEKSRGAVSLMSCVRKAMSAFSVSQFTRGSPYSGTGKVGESSQRYIVYNWTSVHDRVHDDRSRESPYSGTAKASLALALFSGKECKVRIIIQGSTVNRRSETTKDPRARLRRCAAAPVAEAHLCPPCGAIHDYGLRSCDASTVPIMRSRKEGA